VNELLITGCYLSVLPLKNAYV